MVLDIVKTAMVKLMSLIKSSFIIRCLPNLYSFINPNSFLQFYVSMEHLHEKKSTCFLANKLIDDHSTISILPIINTCMHMLSI